MNVADDPSKGRRSTPPQPHAAKGVKLVAVVAGAVLALLALAVWAAAQLLR